MKTSLKTRSLFSGGDPSSDHDRLRLQEENARLRREVERLQEQVQAAQGREMGARAQVAELQFQLNELRQQLVSAKQESRRGGIRDITVNNEKDARQILGIPDDLPPGKQQKSQLK